VAIYWRAPEMLALLRARGAALDVFEAAAAGDADRVRTLLDADPSLRDAHAPDGWTPLHLAGHFREGAVIDLLLARGADVNAVSRNGDANAPLHAAAAGGADVALMRRLVKAGVSKFGVRKASYRDLIWEAGKACFDSLPGVKPRDVEGLVVGSVMPERTAFQSHISSMAAEALGIRPSALSARTEHMCAS